jgi:Natural resistance-associated macrophage protein-like
VTAAGAAISGQVTLRQVQARGRVRGAAALLGPAFVASVAYVDPGNFATNFAGGAGHGYELAWVVVMASLMAMLVQYLTAKAGLATGRSPGPESDLSEEPTVGSQSAALESVAEVSIGGWKATRCTFTCCPPDFLGQPFKRLIWGRGFITKAGTGRCWPPA